MARCACSILPASICSPVAALISATPPKSAASRSPRSRARASRTGASISPSHPDSTRTLMTYAHPDSLVSTEWLAAHLNDPAVRIVDGSFKLPGITPTAQQDYAARHILGAPFFDIDVICD